MARRRYPYESKAAPNNQPPDVAWVTVRTGPWSGDNQLGTEAGYGPDKRQTQTILKMDEWGPPEIWTVSLFVRQDFTLFDGFGIKARINYGAGGSTQVIELDWVNGAQISLPMNAINVEAFFEDVEVTTEGPGLRLGVQIARGTRGGNNPPVFTIAESLALPTAPDPASFQEFMLPAFARYVYAFCCDNTPAEIAEFYSADLMLSIESGNGAGSIVSSAITGLQLAQGIKLPLTRRARKVLIQNGTGTALIVTILAELDG